MMNTRTDPKGSKDKGTKMSSDKQETKGKSTVAEILPNEVIRHIPIANIFADHAWNARTMADTTGDTSDAVQDTTGNHGAQGAGFNALMLSMRDDGQDTPVIVRPVPENRQSFGGKKIPPNFTHELACGF